MANSFDDIVDKQLNQIKTQFKLDVLNGYDRNKWPERIDYVARRAARGSYPIGIQSNTPRVISGGETLDDAAHEHYLDGISKLTGNRRHRTALPADFRLGSLLVQFTDMQEGMDDVGHDALEPGEVLGRLLTRNLKRHMSGDEIQLAEQLSTNIRTPRGLVAELCSVPELADVVESALPRQASSQSLADQLANVDLTTQLWDHQFEALVSWLQNGCDGYVNMATATGKTVLGLAAVAHCVDAGSLHPADQERLSDTLTSEPPSMETQSKNVLIVTTDELLGVQWARLFQTHCHTPAEFTKVTDGSIRLPWGRIDIKSAGGLSDVDPSEYRLAIFDEVHNYTTSGGWGEGLRAFVDSACPVLALTGSVTPELERLHSQVETGFPEVYTYTHTQALDDGVIPDFEWTLSFADVERDSATLDALERTATLADEVVEHQATGLSVSEQALTERFAGLDRETIAAIAGEYETGSQLARAIRETGGDDNVGPTDDLEALASGLSNRSIHRLNLSTDHNVVVDLAEDALERERPVLVLTQSYSEAETIWQALYDRRSDRLVKRLDGDASAAEQDDTITAFDEAENPQKVLIGPGKRIGQGNDIQSVEVGINISRPGSGVNTSLVQRLGRLLRGAGEKDQVEFYHVSGVQPAASVIAPDGESFVSNVSEFFAQVLTPDTDGIHKPPNVRAQSDEVSANVSALEAAGAERVLAHEQPTDIERAYASAIGEREETESVPTVATEWFAEAFPETAETRETDGAQDEERDQEDADETELVDEIEVSVDPIVLAIARMHADRDSQYDSVIDVIDAALDPYLDAVSAESEPPADAFDVTTEHTLGFACDPALEVAIETKMQSEGMDSVDDFVQHAMVEWLGVEPGEGAVVLTDYTEYDQRVRQLVRSDDCPCSTPGEVVQAALEVHFDI